MKLLALVTFGLAGVSCTTINDSWEDDWIGKTITGSGPGPMSRTQYITRVAPTGSKRGDHYKYYDTLSTLYLYCGPKSYLKGGINGEPLMCEKDQRYWETNVDDCKPAFGTNTTVWPATFDDETCYNSNGIDKDETYNYDLSINNRDSIKDVSPENGW